MNEFIYSIIEVSMGDETSENLKIKNETKKARVKFSLLDINFMYESFNDRQSGVMLGFKNGESMFLLDSFDRIDKLHNEYLKEYDKRTLLTAAQ
jgi:hypothetical protein